MTLDDVADELYGLDPGDFVARRTERQKEAKSDGDKALAKEIGALRKPTTVGWVVNQLSRRSADELGDLLDLGDALREAQQHLSGATLRALTKQRQRAVRALARQAGDLAGDKTVTDDTLREVTSTLNAALSDPDIAETVRRGRVLGAVEYSGFGPLSLMSVDDPEPVEPAPESTPEPTPEPDDTAAQQNRADAQTELDDATADEEQAAAALADAEQRIEDRDDAVRALTAERDELTRRLEDLTAKLDAATAARNEATAARDDAADRRTTLHSRVVNAKKRLDRL